MSADERRRYPRYMIQLAGQIAVPGGAAQPCQIRDYCAGGMLIEQAGVGFTVGDTVEITTKLQTPKGGQRVRIKARVAWAYEGRLGAEFPRPSHEIAAMLQRHDQLRRAKQPGQPAPPASAQKAARCKDKLRQVALGRLPGMVDQLLQQFSDDLVQRGDDVASNSERQQLYEDMAAVDALRRGGSDPWVQRLLELALTPGAVDRGKPVAEDQGDGLALIDNDEFERWLEASRVATRLEEAFAPQLKDLEARLASALPAGAKAEVDLPFNPHHFTCFLQELAKQLDLGGLARDSLYSVADAGLRQQLEGFYAELLGGLDELGIVAPAGQKVRPKAAPQPAASASAAAQPDAAAQAPLPATDQPPTAGPTAGAAPAAAGAMGGRVVLSVPHQEQRQAFAQELVDYIAQAPEVSGHLAGWLQQLQAPLAREVVTDENFFLNHEHPLREIIDGLGHLQMFRPQTGAAAENDPLHRAVTQLLRQLSEGEPDPARYREVADKVGVLVSAESRKYQRNVERVVAANVGRDRVRRARLAVAEELDRRYAGKQVPELVPELLESGWRAVLELALLRGGAESEDYVQRLALLDALIALLGGEPWLEASRDTDPAQLYQELRTELGNASFDPVRRNEIETRIATALKDPAAAAQQLVSMPSLLEAEQAPAVPNAPQGITDEGWERLVEQAYELAVGDLVRLQDQQKGQQDLRVAWVRDDRQLYSLVDYRGLRAKDLSLQEVASGLHRRDIELEHTDGRGLSDRAADAMLARMEERLAYQAAHDSLTGLLNRLHFQATLEKHLGEVRERDVKGMLLWIDIDQFRLVNDVYGYDTGDRLLVAVARLLEERYGEGPVLGRLGGDRFAVLLPDQATADADRRANAVCGWVAGMPFDWEGRPTALTASVGVVDLAETGNGTRQALQAAETAVTAAKAAGGNQAYRYRSDDPAIARRQESVHWITQVDEALDRGRLRLRCQPIVPVEAKAGLRSHYEILLGIEDGQGQALSIAEFIAAAETYNRMQAVDRWVTRTTAEWIAAQRKRMDELHGFSVNLSGQTVGDATFVEFVRDLLRRTDIDPDWLSFEVTETAAIADLNHTAAIIRDIKALGCKVALDDFGSGLASYSYLKELPVDWLKIDGVFVRNIATDANDFAVVRSINEIAHFMGKKTVAEYVADEAALRKIRTLGVDYAQGYGIAPPGPLDELLRHGGAADAQRQVNA
jgi:diguanylate cyclase (GGDEF)-like protein